MSRIWSRRECEASFEAADQRVGVAASERQRAITVGEVRTSVRAASGVTPLRPAALR